MIDSDGVVWLRSPGRIRAALIWPAFALAWCGIAYGLPAIGWSPVYEGGQIARFAVDGASALLVLFAVLSIVSLVAQPSVELALSAPRDDGTRRLDWAVTHRAKHLRRISLSVRMERQRREGVVVGSGRDEDLIDPVADGTLEGHVDLAADLFVRDHPEERAFIVVRLRGWLGLPQFDRFALPQDLASDTAT